VTWATRSCAIEGGRCGDRLDDDALKISKLAEDCPATAASGVLDVITFRCDGNDRVGAGHVSRCLQIALAFRAAGMEVVFVGVYGGVAARLLALHGLPTVAPTGSPAGLPPNLDAALVDSYEIDLTGIQAAARERPIAVISDGGTPPPVPVIISYHLDARPPTGEPIAALIGPDYAPVDPQLASARRSRGLGRALVTIGGSRAGTDLVGPAVEALRRIATSVEHPVGAAGLLEEIRSADVAVSAAGLTPYELACAGVPAVIVAIADNQLRVATAFQSAGVALGLDGRTRSAITQLSAAIERLADRGVRERLAAAGPATIDGFGAFRARDALKAALEGRPLPRVLRYRPATIGDSALLFQWRNDPEARRASRNTAPVAPQEHERWLHAALADPTCTLLLAEEKGEAIGTVRFNRRTPPRAEISVNLAPERRGAGRGTKVVREATELELAAHPELKEVVAEIREGNSRSMGAFERAGFRQSPGRAQDGWLRLASARGTWT
jgi:UDP-2,4-diacetamido-2,4,6-trideoxy-beta-L-altropyranose hydrolase